MLSSGSKAQAERMVEVAKKQTEIVRITTLGEKKLKGQGARNYASVTKLGVSSAQKSTNEALAKRGINDKSLGKLLAASKNAKTDQVLDEAEKNGRYDETFLQVLECEFASYENLI